MRVTCVQLDHNELNNNYIFGIKFIISSEIEFGSIFQKLILNFLMGA
jgi:hypothetical protein